MLAAILFLAAVPVLAAGKMDRVRVSHIKKDIDVSSFDDNAWKHAREIEIDTYWSGEKAPEAREFEARLLWSDTALYVRFEADQHETLVVSEKPDLTKKVRGLWERDVCEIFIAPDRNTPNKYFEFEVAPTGEWIDLGIEVTPEKRITDWDYSSGMQAAAKIEKDKVVEVIRIPFKSLGRAAKTGDVWLGNLFRCVGKDPTRGYLAWRPTRTKEPAFHVPSAFGEFEFD
ncbi:MAG: carbohydrate-binding family 9-like protein [Acidobacteria bacterium]|nr:carbohydrate-binding family 9-like protein [Acidobacteriota bacterium]